MELSVVEFSMNSQPNFGELKRKGWIHPMGWNGEKLWDSLVKEFGDFDVQIVRHSTGDWNWTDAYIHSRSDRSIMKEGEGKGMSREEAIGLVDSLYKDVEAEVSI